MPAAWPRCSREASACDATIVRMNASLTQIPVQTIDARPATLDDWAGQVRLVVNVASKCGLTKQYDALEGLYRRLRDRGFVVLGFPANDFAGQEPGALARLMESTASPDEHAIKALDESFMMATSLAPGQPA